MDWLNRHSLYFEFLEVIKQHHYRVHKLLDEIGLYHGQPPMLFILNHEDGQSQTELAEKLDLKAPTITVMVKRMERAGLVLRRPDSKDQRISRVYITEKGREACQKAIQVAKRLEEELFDGINEEEKIALKGFFAKMRGNLEKAIGDKF